MMDEVRLIFRVVTEEFDIVVRQQTAEIVSFHDKERIIFRSDDLPRLMYLLKLAENHRIPF